MGLISSSSGSEGLMTSTIFLMPLTMSSVEGRAVLEYAEQHRAVAVNVHDVGLHRAAIVHLRDVMHINHGSAHVLDGQIGRVRKPWLGRYLD